MGSLLQMFFLDHVQNSLACCTRDRVASKCVEVAHVLSEVIDDFRASNDTGNGLTITHRLAERDNIGTHAMPRETPHVQAGTSKT
ncbi:hypothetical protein FQZ97_1140700 [compost metagenome]